MAPPPHVVLGDNIFHASRLSRTAWQRPISSKRWHRLRLPRRRPRALRRGRFSTMTGARPRSSKNPVYRLQFTRSQALLTSTHRTGARTHRVKPSRAASCGDHDLLEMYLHEVYGR